jgi:hypothetical protein
MAKKEYIKLTPEGLNLLTVINYSSMTESITGVYNREIFFTDGFAGHTQYLFQALGNLGAYPRSNDLGSDVSYIIISNKIIASFTAGVPVDFISDLENRLNQNNSPWRRIRILTENHIVWYLEYRAKTRNDEQLEDLLKKYKLSIKESVQQELF